MKTVKLHVLNSAYRSMFDIEELEQMKKVLEGSNIIEKHGYGVSQQLIKNKIFIRG